MPIETATSIKEYFQTGDRPTQAQFGIFIDSAVRTANAALANKFESGATGLVRFISQTDVTAQDTGTFGLQVLTADTSVVATRNILANALMLTPYTDPLLLTTNATAGVNSLFSTSSVAAVRRFIDNGLSIINARDYGALGDGTTDDTTAMQAALTAAANKILVVPPGVYKLSSQLTLTNGVHIAGCGVGTSELRWTAAAASVGISLSADGYGRKNHTIRDLLLSNAGTTGDAITLDYSSQIINIGGGVLMTANRTAPRYTIENVHICGTDLLDINTPSTTGWTRGIYTKAHISGVIRDVVITGKSVGVNQAPVALTNGIYVTGSPVGDTFENGHPVIITCDNCSIWAMDVGINIQNVEGVFISHSNAVNCNYGYLVQGHATGGFAVHPQVSIHDSHSNVFQYNVYIQNMLGVTVHDNTFYTLPAASANPFQIVYAYVYLGSIRDNFVHCGNSDGTGIYCTNSENITIIGNTINPHTQGIRLTSTALNCRLGLNTFRGSFTNRILNEDGTGTNKGLPIASEGVVITTSP